MDEIVLRLKVLDDDPAGRLEGAPRGATADQPTGSPSERRPPSTTNTRETLDSRGGARGGGGGGCGGGWGRRRWWWWWRHGRKGQAVRGPAIVSLVRLAHGLAGVGADHHVERAELRRQPREPDRHRDRLLRLLAEAVSRLPGEQAVAGRRLRVGRGHERGPARAGAHAAPVTHGRGCLRRGKACPDCRDVEIRLRLPGSAVG
jgi:hypothetical protein